ncbi:MAG: hypothetical protein ACJ79M_12250 [Myxococcales bacterium]
MRNGSGTAATLCALFGALLGAGCAASPPALQCGIDADCGANAFCSAGQCLAGTKLCPIIEPKFSSINQSIFRISCGTTGSQAINCHSGDGAASASGLDLVTDPYGSLVGQPAITTFLPAGASAFNLILVAPGDGTKEGSFLIRKLLIDTPIDPQFGAAMPADQQHYPAICADTIATISQWITQGAPRN